MSEPKSDCNINTSNFPEVCLKLKFHFIKYLNSPEEFPSDKLYVNLLNQLNEIFNKGNITFTFDGDCIHYLNYGDGFNTGGSSADAFERKSTILNNKTEFGFDENAINIYSFTKSGGGEAYLGENVLFCATSLSALAHELGHTLGLWHTFGKGNPFGNPVNPFSTPWVCKDGTNDSGFQGDDVSDTGADPYTMDLDNNGIADQWKWFIQATCNQNISNSQTDFCNDNINPWNIPIDNWMSYYGECKKCFTEGQYSRMHQYIEDYFEDMVVSDCADDPYFNPVDCQQADITISTPTLWENGTLELCKDQKIIIEAGGSLTLRNYTLTKKQGNNPACPGLSKFGEWDGIYLSGFSANNSSVKPSLLVLENSEISHSNHGIHAYQFNEIRFDASQMISNGAGIDARHGVSGLYVENNSLIDGSSASIDMNNLASYREITLINCAGKFSSSTVSGKGLSTGIYSYYGTLRFSNHNKVVNFETAVYKDIDKINGGFDAFGSSGAGIWASNSFFKSTLNKYEAVYLNSTRDAVFFDNDLVGIVVSRGKSTGTWHHNYFKGEHENVNYISLANPDLAYEFKDNLIEYTRMEFYGRNPLSNAICNSWLRPQNFAVQVYASPFISSWGTETSPSGNRVSTPDVYPIMTSPDVQVTNYFKIGNPPEMQFSYSGNFIGTGIAFETSCNYRLTGGPGTAGFSESCDETQAEADWDSLEALRLNLLDSIGSQTDSLLLIQLNNSLDQVLLEQSKLAARMLRCHREDSLWTATGDTWVERLDTDLLDLNALSELWNQEAFDQVMEFEQIAEEDLDDFEVLQSAAQYLLHWQLDSLDIYQLPISHLDTLIELAESHYGEYSNYLRSWLYAYYGIRLDWPEEMQSYARIPDRTPNQTISDWIIIPNPVVDCFKLISEFKPQMSLIKLFNLHGSLMFEQKLSANQEICIPEHLSSGLYILNLTDVRTNVNKTFKLWLR